MAALSSECGRSTTKTVRITYQELVELAEALEKDKKERTYKAKSEEVEGACSTYVSPCENVSPSKETNSPISKSEKKTLEDRKSSSRKDSDKKKHKERKRDKKDEKSLKNKAENEAFEVQNKEFVEANFTAELGDDEDNAKQTAKDKKKLRKRSPKSKEKSIEETANIEESVEKLKLHDNDQESKSKHKERTKKHSDSKKKERKKYKQNNDECPDEESKVINHKQDFINNEDEQLNNDHHHGILKSPNSKSNHYHSHVSFSEETDSHIIDYNTGEERGILRIPQGVNIHDGEVIESQQYTDKDIEAEYSRNDDVSNSISNQTPVQSSHSQSDVSKSKSCEQEDLKLNSAEKRLRSLNRQRAQQLVKQAHHAENTLSNLLSKGVTEQGALKKVFLLSKEIQDLYQGVIMLDLSFTQQHDIDQRLWKNAFYQVIETFRKYGKLFLGYSSQKDTISPEKINAELGDFLQAAGNFYSGLLNGLQKTYHFDVQVIVSQPRKAEFLARSAKLALLSCHHTLIFLGDIERYKNQLKPYSTLNWSGIRSWYLKASKLAPKNGKPYNQLAVIAVYANRKLDAVFYYVRSLCVNSPILTAKEKLTTIFYEIQKKADQLHWEEVQERKRQHEMKVQRERSAGRGRNVFREVAKGVGLVGGTNSGRHEIWLFIRQGKYRRLVLTEHGAVQQVDAMGKPISRDVQEEPEPKKETKQESPKISLQEVNKKFMLHFLCAHGLLYTRIGMERLPGLQVQLIGELHTLLRYPQCSSVGYYPLLQMAAINMFAIDHTAPQEETKEPFVRLGTPQDQALNLSMEVLVTLLNACTELLNGGDHGNMLSDTLRQYVPTIKVWFDWLICHQDLWQISNISIHRTLWEAVSQFTNAILQLQLPCFEEDENEEVLVTLTEDEFLAGFKPLINAEHSVLDIKISQNKELVQDHLHIAAFKKFAMQMSSMSNPTMQYCEETRQFSAVIPSLPASPEQTDSSVAVHMDVEHQNNQECYESDEVIIEGVLEDIDSGDEADKGFKELKAKKDQLARELEDHEEKHSKARAVVHENISRAHLMFENYPNYLVPDTNCFIDQLSGLQAIVMSNDFTLIVPIVVINELDGLKKDFLVDKYHDYNHAQMVMNNARAAIDFLEDQFSRRSPYVKALTSKGTVMDTIAFRSEDTSSRKGNNDDVILSCCLHYCEENFVNRLATADQPITIRRNVVLLTDDRNLRVKAYTRNVPVLTVPQFRQMARL